MKLPIAPGRPLVRLALACTAIFVAGLLSPVYSTAGQGVSHAEERATRQAERETRAKEREEARATREQEHATRQQEREASRVKRAEERTARQDASGSAGGGSGEPGAEPTAVAQRGCHITIQTSSSSITAGESVTIAGTLQCSTATDAAGQQIAVYRRQHGAGPQSFAIAGTVPTTSSGSYELSPGPLYTNTLFQVRVGRHRARAVVKVAPRVTLTASSSNAQTSAAPDQSRPNARTDATFTGTVTPAVEGARVALQVAYPASSGHWRSVAFGRVAADGGYSIAHLLRFPGEASVRAIVHNGEGDVAGISEPLTYEVSQPQNPQLTILTSADPISRAEQVKISGLAAEAPNQPVKLLARSSGGAFTVVAEGTTDFSGNYTFTQEPLENTAYQVTDASTHSTTLFEGVALALTVATPPTMVQAAQPLTFSGTLAFAPAGQTVYLERGYAAGIGFHVVGSATVGASSEYQIPYTFAHDGTEVMRVKAPGDSRHLPSISAPFTIAVSG